MTDDHDLTLTRVFDAPRRLVYAMWSDPDHLRRWCLPAGFSAPDNAVDFRVGGEWRETLRGPDGTTYRSLSVFKEIIAGERIVFTQTWLDDDGTPGRETMVTVTLTDAGDGRTELTFRQTGFATTASRDSHAHGWAETLDRLAAYLLGAESTAAE